MKKLLVFLVITLMPMLCYGEITVPEINPEHTLVKATVDEEGKTWHVFVWRNNQYNAVEYVLTENKECVFTGAPGSYLLVNGADFATAIIGHAPPPDVSVGVDDTDIKEGNNGITPANFIVSLNKASNEEVLVDYTTEDNTAIMGEDYKPVNGTLQFNPGETQKLVTVEVLGDTVEEENESFFLKLVSVSENVVISKDKGVCNIVDDDDPTPPPPPDGFEDAVYQLIMSLPEEWREHVVDVDGEEVLMFVALGNNYEAVAAEAAATSMTPSQMINAVKVRNVTTAGATNIDAIRKVFFQPLAVLIIEEDLDLNNKDGHVKIWKLIANAMKRVK